ncbi:MAG TPA: TIGR03862 family flavoprotein [Xanthobacteraceae bacterium]|nr:TIGR03862 family flavoprotein [Xanthobacteraceae bacterium]
MGNQSSTGRPHVAVIGGGPAGLMAAEVLASGGARVTLYERMPSAGRKFLLAGRGGLNLTHGEEPERLLDRYGAARPRLRAAIAAFSPADVRAWCEGLGQSTFVGSSGRVFPQAFKASPLLRAWLRRLDAAGVAFKPRHLWVGWDEDGALVFVGPAGPVAVQADATVLALGGASWPRLGSDGGWVEAVTKAGIAVTPLMPANCGFMAGWSDVFSRRFEGQPLKRIEVSFAGRAVRGEAIITRSGLEGAAIYALSASLRAAIAAHGEAVIHIDLRPDIAFAALEQRLHAPRGKQSLATFLRKTVALAPAAVGLLHEATMASPQRPSAMAPQALAGLIKAVPVRLRGVALLASAISTAGGIAFEDVNESFMLRGRPGVFVAGEMLDWEAPTGGYLLQATFSTGAAAARGALDWLAHRFSALEQ